MRSNSTKDFAFEKWDVNNDDQIDMTEFDNFMMPILEMRRNQKTDQVFEPHDKGKAFKIDNLPDVFGIQYENELNIYRMWPIDLTLRYII